nr:MAG TPA: hypothetical protein [Caudoviricetes sp.]DAL99270.1 MAG TPA: hypothetical protein [Caudoviricetes sp.]
MNFLHNYIIRNCHNLSIPMWRANCAGLDGLL